MSPTSGRGWVRQDDWMDPQASLVYKSKNAEAKVLCPSLVPLIRSVKNHGGKCKAWPPSPASPQPPTLDSEPLLHDEQHRVAREKIEGAHG